MCVNRNLVFQTERTTQGTTLGNANPLHLSVLSTGVTGSILNKMVLLCVRDWSCLSLLFQKKQFKKVLIWVEFLDCFWRGKNDMQWKLF